MKVDPKQEHNLLIGLVNGDESSFCELYALYKGRLIYFAMKFLKSTEFAEDVFQDAFASVWESRRFINPNQPFAPYIYTIIKNRILNLLAGIEKETELKQKLISNAVNYTQGTENRLLENEYEDLFQKALNTLTEQQRRIFELSRTEQKSHKEIAEELNISVYTVQQHISTSLKTIREYLKKHAGVLTDLILLLFCLNL
ncbi:MAG: RNA polymerase sigma-70 factor [Massilibacteroides sp.]|nr:RNA polymerase sigma-70 factor [Massilibacteroides sp.]MDD3063115.1 RNA polymerase sigma-70 factor [Massilibacteroides sp.]